MDNNELYHHGVKGMKWGVRRAQKKANVALRKAGSAIGEKRRQKFLDLYNKRKVEADRREEEYKQARRDLLEKELAHPVRYKAAKIGKTAAKVALGVLGTIAVVEVTKRATAHSIGQKFIDAYEWARDELS